MRRIGIHGAGAIPIASMSLAGPLGGNPWWDPEGEGLCVWAAYQPKGADDLASSYVDLSGNGNNCGPGTAPTWDVVNGWKFNGTTQYLDTSFVPQNDQTQSILVQFTTSTDDDWLCGCSSGAGKAFGIRDINNVQYWNGSGLGVGAKLVAGNLGVAGSAGYRDGSAAVGAIGAWTGPTTNTLYIGAVNTGAASVHAAFYCQAFVIYDCTLTATQVAAVYAAMAAL